VPIDVWNLIDRDHRELENALDLFIATPTSDLLDEVRLGLAAHVEAEGKALVLLFSHRLPPHIAALFTELSASHRAQERHLVRLIDSPRAEWADRARTLRDIIHQHHDFERTWCLPVLHAHIHADEARKLVATYATERLRALALTWPLAEVASARA
jgi:hypothetical protein